MLFYFTSYVLNMFRTLIYPSSGACDYSVELPHWSYCSWFDVCWEFRCGWVGVVSVLQAASACNMDFHENPSIGIRDVSRGQTDEQTDMTKQVVAFHNFAIAFKISRLSYRTRFLTIVLTRDHHFFPISTMSIYNALGRLNF